MSEEQSKLSEEQRKVIEESDEFHPYDCELNFTVKFSLHRDKEPTKEEMIEAYTATIYNNAYDDIIGFFQDRRADYRKSVDTPLNWQSPVRDVECTALLNPDYSEECDCCGAGVIARDGTVIDEEARQYSYLDCGTFWLCGEHPYCASS